MATATWAVAVVQRHHHGASVKLLKPFKADGPNNYSHRIEIFVSVGFFYNFEHSSYFKKL
jgi:hypothetical protein